MLELLSWLLKEIKVGPEGLVSTESRIGSAELQKNKCWTKEIRHQTCALLHSLRPVLSELSDCPTPNELQRRRVQNILSESTSNLTMSIRLIWQCTISV